MFRLSAIATILALTMTTASYSNSVIAYGTVTDRWGLPIEEAQVFIGYRSPMTPCPIPVSDIVNPDANGVYSVAVPFRELVRGTRYHLFARSENTQGYSSEADKVWDQDFWPISPMYFHAEIESPGTLRPCLTPVPYEFDIHP